MWCVVVLWKVKVPRHTPPMRPSVPPNPSIFLLFRINNRRGEGGMVCGSTARCMCEVVHAIPPSPDHSRRRAAPPPLLHLRSRPLQRRLRLSEMTPPNPHFRIQPSFYLPPPSPPLPYLSPPTLPSPYLPPPSPPSPSNNADTDHSDDAEF